MAFNGSGTYNLPAGNPVTTGTTISSSWANSTLSDIASALTNCITRDGQSPPTANIPHGGYKLTGLGQASATGDALGWGQNASVGTFAALGAATFSSTVALSADPTTNLQAATKQYVDANAGAFASGTAMLFVQTSAPTGWTKSTTHNDKALRIVSGTASSGGSYTFSSTFANGNAGATTLSESQIPSHSHAVTTYVNDGAQAGIRGGTNATSNTFYTGATGGGGAHTHSLSLAVQYVDAIIAVKD
jgi:hypothetical protein